MARAKAQTEVSRKGAKGAEEVSRKDAKAQRISHKAG
jgi:hypothetical protein